MKDYLQRTGRKKVMEKRWLGRCQCKSCCCMLQLRWYVEHGAVIKTIHRTIDYRVTKLFTLFVEQVRQAWRFGDVDKSKAVLAEVFTCWEPVVMGNSLKRWSGKQA